jgi:hypothetical protein
MPERIEPVTGLRDEDMVTLGPSPAPTLPATPRAAARLSFDALAKLFADHRPTLIDADLTTIPTRELNRPPRPDAS